MKNKGLIAIALICCLLAACGGTVYAVGQVARSSAISEEAAINFACVDAGISPEDITRSRIDFDYERGVFVYDIDFIAGDTEYEYTIHSANGSVIESAKERVFNQAVLPAGTPSSEGSPTESTSSGSPLTPGSSGDYAIDEEEAFANALKDAGVKEADVTLKRTKLERDDGRIVYDVEFALIGEKEFDYSIDALTGEIVEKSSDVWEMEDYLEYGLTIPDGNKPAEPITQANASGSDATLSIEEAKDVALSHAGVNKDTAVISKAKLEHDDGLQKYDIEFYVPGDAEYEYEINAATGVILEYDRESLMAASSTPANNSTQNSSQNSSAGGSSGSSGSSSGFSEGSAPASSGGSAEANASAQQGSSTGLSAGSSGNGASPGSAPTSSGSSAEASAPATAPAQSSSKPAATTPSAPAATAPSAPAQSSSKPAATTPSAPAQSSSTPAATTPSAPAASTPSTPAATTPSAPAQSSSKPAATTPSTPAPASNQVVSGDDIYKEEGGVVYEYDDDDGTWEAESDKKIENGQVYEYEDDTNTWEPEDSDKDDWYDDDRDDHDDWDDDDDDDDDD